MRVCAGQQSARRSWRGAVLLLGAGSRYIGQKLRRGLRDQWRGMRRRGSWRRHASSAAAHLRHRPRA